MAVSMREIPVITGRNALDFLKREKENEKKLEKRTANLTIVKATREVAATLDDEQK